MSSCPGLRPVQERGRLSLETLSWELQAQSDGLESPRVPLGVVGCPGDRADKGVSACPFPVLTSLSTSLVALCPQMKYIQDFQREKQEFERNLARFR